jgi:hypothetical protein
LKFRILFFLRLGRCCRLPSELLALLVELSVKDRSGNVGSVQCRFVDDENAVFPFAGKLDAPDTDELRLCWSCRRRGLCCRRRTPGRSAW